MRSHAVAWNGLRRHPGRILGMLAEQLIVRLIVLLPVLLPVFFPSFSKNKPFSLPAFRYGVSAVLVFLLLFPMRFRAGATLRGCVSDAQQPPRCCPYPSLVLAGVIRFLLGAVWGIPFLFGLYRFYQYMFVYEASRAGQLISDIGAKTHSVLSFIEPQLLGLAVIVAFFLITGILFVCGWHRDAAYDFLMVNGASPAGALREAAAIRKSRRRPLNINLLIAFLLLLPPAAAFVFLMNLLSGSLRVFITSAYYAFCYGMITDKRLFIWPPIAFFALYLPFLPYRKARNAAVVCNDE